MSEPVELPRTDRRWSGARVWARDERFRLLMGRMTPGSLLVAGAGVAWQRPDLTGWLITGGLGLTGAGLEAWRTWLAYQYAMTELRNADQAQQRAAELEQQRLQFEDQHDARAHELQLLSQSMQEAHRSARLEKVDEREVTELARIEEEPGGFSIDLRDSPMPAPRRPRGPDRYSS